VIGTRGGKGENSEKKSRQDIRRVRERGGGGGGERKKEIGKYHCDRSTEGKKDQTQQGGKERDSNPFQKRKGKEGRFAFCKKTRETSSLLRRGKRGILIHPEKGERKVETGGYPIYLYLKKKKKENDLCYYSQFPDWGETGNRVKNKIPAFSAGASPKRGKGVRRIVQGRIVGGTCPAEKKGHGEYHSPF